MSETKERDAVRAEFSEVGGLYLNTDAMIDDVLHLRDERQRLVTENASLRADVERLRALATSDWKIVKEHARERQRLERILAALREPSEVVVQAAQDEYGFTIHYPFHGPRLTQAIRAAVAAAEREVGARVGRRRIVE